MPDTDGISLLKEWSAAGLLTMPVVMMSGHGTIDSAVEATQGAIDFLEKPIALQKLLTTVKKALKHDVSLRKTATDARRFCLLRRSWRSAKRLNRQHRKPRFCCWRDASGSTPKFPGADAACTEDALAGPVDLERAC